MAEPKRRWWLYVVGLLGVALLACCLVTALWTEQKKFTVTRHAWSRSVDVEARATVEKTENCQRVPKERWLRDEWSMQRINGERKNVHLCTYLVDEWAKARTEQREGEGLGAVWPGEGLAENERAGARDEKYRLDFTGDDGKPYACTLKESGWRKVQDGQTIELTLSKVTGQPVCLELN